MWLSFASTRSRICISIWLCCQSSIVGLLGLSNQEMNVIELDDGKIYRKPLYFPVDFPFNQSIENVFAWNWGTRKSNGFSSCLPFNDHEKSIRNAFLVGTECSEKPQRIRIPRGFGFWWPNRLPLTPKSQWPRAFPSGIIWGWSSSWDGKVETCGKMGKNAPQKWMIYLVYMVFT